jgi:hypothetical protein
MYVRPRKSRYLKDVALMPGAEEIVKAISKKTGEIISMYGAAAENYVGLSTQIQVNAIYYTTCVFRPRPNADSSPSRTLIPISPEHSFQS